MKAMKIKVERIAGKTALVLLTVLVLFIIVQEASRYFGRLSDRLTKSVAMFTRHKDVKNEYPVKGNIVFVANSSFQWIFPPTDFNYYFFVKQNKVNGPADTVFNASLLAPQNILLANQDDRQRFDTHVYWENEDVRRFLYRNYNVVSFKDLKQIDPAKAIKEYVQEKNAGYILTDLENMKFFEKDSVVAKFPAQTYADQCFEYHLLNDIYLLKIR